MSCPPIDLLYETYRTTLVHHVTRSFPRLCPGTAEDAAEATFEALLQHPDRLARAWADGGERRALALMRQIAWRTARAVVTRGAGQREVCIPATDLAVASSTDANQEHLVHLHQVLDELVPLAVAAVSPKRAEALGAAFRDRLRSGDDDTTVARRHGIPREYLSRVRREVRRLADAS